MLNSRDPRSGYPSFGFWGIVLATLFLVVGWFPKVVITAIVFLIDPSWFHGSARVHSPDHLSQLRRDSAAGPACLPGRMRMRKDANGGTPADADLLLDARQSFTLTSLSVHRLTKAQARRIAVRAQTARCAAADRRCSPSCSDLTLLQIDPTAAIAPSADLVAWSRLGSSYRPAQLKQALEQDRTLFELDAVVRPMSDLGLHLAGAAEWPSHERTRDWLRDNDRFRRDILELLGSSGPLSSRDIPDTCVVPWPSTGWTNNRNVTQMLEFLMMRGEVAIAGRVGRERLWDLPERVYPADVDVPSVEEARAGRNERRLAALGIARRKTTAMPIEPVDVGDAGEPAVVEGVEGRVARRPGRARRRTSRAGRRCCRRSTGSSTTASAPRSCSTSSTRSRCTSRRPSAAGATSRSRSSTTTGSSGRSTRSPTARRPCCG